MTVMRRKTFTISEAFSKRFLLGKVQQMMMLYVAESRVIINKREGIDMIFRIDMS